MTSTSAQKQSSDLKRAFAEDGELKTHIGGQALIEGIMMRGKYNWSVAVREPSGAIYTEEHPLPTANQKNKWMHWPFIRGCVALVDSLLLGYKALALAAEHAFDEEGVSFADKINANETEKAGKGVEPTESLESADETADTQASENTETAAFGSNENSDSSSGIGSENVLPAVSEEAAKHTETVEGLKPAEANTSPSFVPSSPAAEPTASTKKDSEDSEGILGQGAMAASMVLGIILGVALFVVAPAFLSNLIIGDYDSNPLVWNIFDGIIRVAIFVFYLWLIGRMKDIKRMFSYHGAEHKTIHCYEHGLELTPENARSFPRLHVRCGTAFLIMVMIIAILVYTIIPLQNLIGAWGIENSALKLALVIVVRILFIPLIAGIAYEVTVKWAGSHPDNILVKIILWPGMQMQYLTTNEPDDSMLECAIEATKLILEQEKAYAHEHAANPQ